MRLSRLVCIALALTVISGWAMWSYACDHNKSTAAAASHAGVCTPEMAAQCTPEMAAACKASMAAGGPDLCRRMKATAAVTAGHVACNDKAAATTAAIAAKGGAATAVVAAGSDHCAMAKASAVTAAAGGACAAKRAAAVVAGSSCAAKGAAAVAAGGSCAGKGTAVSAGVGQCTGHGMASMAALSAHADCEACLDMADCSGALDAAGAHRQTVRLKNGVMYVYTADSPRAVSAVQAAVARRADHMTRLSSAGEKARLCAECKAMRGAMASGKLHREVVNIEGGSLTLITSSDAAVVARIHAMTEQKVAARIKS